MWCVTFQAEYTRIFGNVNLYCWGRTKVNASFNFNMWWSSHYIQRFWKMILEFLREVTGCLLPVNSLIILVLGINRVSRGQQHIPYNP